MPGRTHGQPEETTRTRSEYPSSVSTETELAAWRWGSTQAERLAAAILSIEGYQRIAPQAPLGGPDDRKDILAERDTHTALAAVYFPGSPQPFSDVKAKYKHDREGVNRHSRDRFVFLTNQNLTLGQRAELMGEHTTDEIYELQRLTTLLDSPRGYGLRLGHLRIAMTPEDQIAFFDTLEFDRQVEREALAAVAGRTLDLLDDVRALVVATAQRPIVGPIRAPLSELRLSDIRLVHRLTVGPPLESRFRSVDVWVAGEAGRSLSPVAPPADVPSLMYDLCAWWRTEYESAALNPKNDDVVALLARFFHRFVTIHPFVDGNGRVARALVDQAAHELLGKGVSPEIADRRIETSDAIRRASEGDFGILERLLAAALQ